MIPLLNNLRENVLAGRSDHFEVGFVVRAVLQGDILKEERTHETRTGSRGSIGRTP